MKRLMNDAIGFLVLAVWLAFVLVITIGPFYVAWHFISKYW